jgi:AraC-like DNA-binding protein
LFLHPNRFSHPESRVKRREGGSPILPIYCLFLSLGEKWLLYPEPSSYLVQGTKEAFTVKNTGKSAAPSPDQALALRKGLAGKIASFIGSKEKLITDIPGLLLTRRTAPTAPASATYEPSLAVVAQGRKRADLAGTTFIFDESRYLLTSLDLPVICNVIEASEEVPYLCFVLKLDMHVVRELLSREEIQAPDSPSDSPAMATGETTAELLDACCRLIDLLNTPQDIPFLSGLIQREIIYRILRGSEGARLRAIATLGDQSHRTAKAIAWVRTNYAKALRVEDLAKIAGMGVSTLHHHFRALTAMSPLQYQKQLRLQAARERMLMDGLDAASAAFEVGYESASQFNREYARFFGQPPMRDVRTLRSPGALPLESVSSR